MRAKTQARDDRAGCDNTNDKRLGRLKKRNRSLTNLPNNVETVLAPIECYRVLEREELQSKIISRQLSK
jgi:hypothetical protein